MKITDRRLLIVLAIHVTEVLGFSIILPFLPLFARDMGATPLTIGLILTVFSLFQFVSAPIMGRLSDMYGRRPLLMLSQLSTFLSFVVLGFAGSLWMIFLSRIIDGMLGSNFTIAQAYLSDISSKKDRSKVFALTGVAFGIGFFIGPAIGGFFSRFGYSIPSFIAAGIAGLTILLTYFYLPETVERQARTFKVKIVDLNAFKKYFKLPKISMRLWEFLAYISAMMLWTSSIALFTDMQLGFSAEQVGYLLGYVGLISIFLRGFLIPRLIDKYGEDKLIINGFYTMVLGLVFASISSNIWLFLIGTSLFAYGAGVLRPLLMGSISRAASSKEQGAVMGVANSLASLAQIYGPLIGGYILTYYKPTYLGLLAAMVMTGGLIMVIKERRLLAINS